MPRAKVNHDHADPAKEVAEAPPVQRILDNGLPNPEAMDVWSYMDMLTPDQWQDHVGYLYRTRPVMKTRSMGKESFLLKFYEPIDEEVVKQKYGGYDFTLHLKLRSVGTKVYVHRFSIPAEPIFQPGEEPEEKSHPSAANPAVPADPANAQVMSLFERLLTDVLKQRDTAAQEGKGFNASDAFKAALETQKDSAAQAIAFVREQSKGIDSGMTAMFTKMMEHMMEKKESKLETMLLEKLLDRAFGDGGGADKADPLEQVERILNLSDRLRGSGGGSRSSGNDWASVGKTLVENLPGILQNGKELLQTAAMTRIAATTPRAGVAGAPAAGATTQPQRPAIAASPASAQPQQPGAPATAVPGQITEEQAVSVLENSIKLMLVRKLFSQETGDSAAEVADAMHRPFAEHLAEIIKADYTQLASDPILRQAATHPNVMTFCQEYVAYFEEAGDAEPPADAPDSTTTGKPN